MAAGTRGRPFVGLGDHPRGLFPKRLGQSLVPPAHLVMRRVTLGLTCLVGGDLRGGGAPSALLLQACFDLLPPGTRRLEIVGRIATNLRLSAGSSFDLIPERHEFGGELRTIDRRCKLLRPVELTGLQRSWTAVGHRREIEDHRVRVQLRR